jgi:hypothetical protein
MSLKVVSKAYSETFSSATSWTVNHGLGTESPAIDVYNNSDVRVMPSSIVVLSEDALRVDWSVATAGRVYVV